MSGAETAVSPQLQLIYEWVEGFKTKDVNHLAKYLHKDHRRITYPRSLNIPEQTKDEWLEHVGTVLTF
jgi:hypothetical protein